MSRETARSSPGIVSAIRGQDFSSALAGAGATAQACTVPRPFAKSPNAHGGRSMSVSSRHHFRFHAPHAHLASVFGDDWFAVRAEAFARFFGTPLFLVAQTVVVAFWIAVNAVGLTRFDVYPFILLNLAFSLQAAYAAPLILLAQTRQADRDKAHTDADAQHREDLARASEERQLLASKQTAMLLELLQQNTQLTQVTKELTERIVSLTSELHGRVCQPKSGD